MAVIPFPQNAAAGCYCSDAPSRLILPMAPQAVARTRFSGGDKLPQAVPLPGALNWLADLAAQGRQIAGLELDGPGDPLASPELSREIIGELHRCHPQWPISLATLGFGLADQAEGLARAGLAEVSLLIDTHDTDTAGRIYRWLRPGKKNVPLAQAVKTLAEEQARGIAALKAAGIPVAVRTAVYAGINDQEVDRIARWAANAGVESMGLLPGRGLDEAGMPLAPPSLAELAELENRVAGHLPLTCRSGQETRADQAIRANAAAGLPKPSLERPNVAVLSANGMDIDLHLGQAYQALIYGPREDGLACLLEARDLPDPGSGDSRWQELAGVVHDCFALLASHAGQRPRDILAGLGLPVLLLEGGIEGAVDTLYGGGKKSKNR